MTVSGYSCGGIKSMFEQKRFFWFLEFRATVEFPATRELFLTRAIPASILTPDGSLLTPNSNL